MHYIDTVKVFKQPRTPELRLPCSNYCVQYIIKNNNSSFTQAKVASPAFLLVFAKLKWLHALLNAQKAYGCMFSSDRVCLKRIQPLCLIESAQKALSQFVSFEQAQDTCGYFHQIYMPRKHMVVYFERACQEGVHLHIFNRVRMLKSP